MPSYGRQTTLAALNHMLTTFPQRMHFTVVQALQVAAVRSVPLMRRRTQHAPPTNPRGIGPNGAVNTGRYLGGWASGGLPDGAVIYNSEPHSFWVDMGRRAGRRVPPPAAIELWASTRLGRQISRAEAWAIGHAIARRGLRPRRVLQDAIPDVGFIVDREVERAIDRELMRLL